jgi:hypothetical protein
METLSDNIVNMILYVPSPSLEYFLKTKMKERFAVHRDFIVTTSTVKALHNAKLDSYVAPLMCNKWLIHVEADKLTKKDLITYLGNNTMHGLTVYWTSKYGLFKQLTNLDIVKKQGVHSPNFSFSRLGYSDIGYLHTEMIKSKNKLNTDLLDFVCKNYMYDVQSVCDLFTMMNSGMEVTTKREIIENVGAGGNSVASLTIRLLMSSPKTDRGKKKLLADMIKLVEDLSITYKHDIIRRFMLNNIDGFIDMKQLQIMGMYKRLNVEIPENFDTKRLSMLKRFERIILSEISLPQLLNLKLCILHYNDFNGEVALIQAISEYCNSLKVEG